MKSGKFTIKTIIVLLDNDFQARRGGGVIWLEQQICGDIKTVRECHAHGPLSILPSVVMVTIMIYS